MKYVYKKGIGLVPVEHTTKEKRKTVFSSCLIMGLTMFVASYISFNEGHTRDVVVCIFAGVVFLVIAYKFK